MGRGVGGAVPPAGVAEGGAGGSVGVGTRVDVTGSGVEVEKGVAVGDKAGTRTAISEAMFCVAVAVGHGVRVRVGVGGRGVAVAVGRGVAV